MPIVKEIDLTSGELALPSTFVGMVVAQPFTELTETEPFTCDPQLLTRQLEIVKRTLDISLACPHGQAKTHFTLFPEYSIPSTQGVALVDEYVARAEWPIGTIVIGGLDALTKQEYVELLARPGTNVDEQNDAGKLQPGEWVNCCVTWIKLSDGSIQRWVQPKMTPALPEAILGTEMMYRGKSIYMFKARLDDNRIARFFTLVCFDWVGSIGNDVIWKAVAAEMEADAERRGADSYSITWTFVIQHNPQPNHTVFLDQIKGYFNQTQHPRLQRNQACLVMVNRAGRLNPGHAEEYASTAIVNSSLAGFFKQPCPATYGSGGLRYRPNNQLENLSDCFFREAGACIYSFAQRNPQSVPGGAAAKTLSPIETAFVHSLEGENDPRCPGTFVPCSLKRFHDEVDLAAPLSKAHPHAKLADDSEVARDAFVIGYRKLEATRLEAAVRLASPSLKSANNAEEWGHDLTPAITLLVQAVSLTGVADKEQRFDDASFHATSMFGDSLVNIMVVRAPTHEDSAKHINSELPMSRYPIAVISKDEDNTEWIPEFGSFLSAASIGSSTEGSITDPASALHFIGYSSVLSAYLKSQTADQLNEELRNAILR